MLGMTPATTMAPLPCSRAFIALDIRHEIHPQQFSLKTRLLRTGYAIGYRQADAIVCISNRTRDDICWRPSLPAPTASAWPRWGRTTSSPGLPREPGPEYTLTFGQWGNKNVDLDARRLGPPPRPGGGTAPHGGGPSRR